MVVSVVGSHVVGETVTKWLELQFYLENYANLVSYWIKVNLTIFIDVLLAIECKIPTSLQNRLGHTEEIGDRTVNSEQGHVNSFSPLSCLSSAIPTGLRQWRPNRCLVWLSL